MPNPGLSPEIMEAMQRRGMGSSSPALNQVSPNAPMANPLPQPTPQSQLTQASAPQGAPAGEAPQMPKFQPQNRQDLIVMALTEQLKNDNKLDKEKAQMPTQQAPMGGGGYAYQKPMGGGQFSMSPGYEQPLPINQMQGDYQSGRYTGLDNYGKGQEL